MDSVYWNTGKEAMWWDRELMALEGKGRKGASLKAREDKEEDKVEKEEEELVAGGYSIGLKHELLNQNDYGH